MVDLRTDTAVADFNDRAYLTMGFGAQRRYPNEEFCRFMGRNFFAIAPDHRKSVRILELGCGSASNLWMVAREGFDAYGIDLSEASLPLAKRMLASYGTNATLQAADMRSLPFPDEHFDCVADIFSSYCLDEAGFRQTLAETARVLKPKGRLFIYTPGKGSDAWTNHAPALTLDASTLSGIARETSAYFPAPYPFRFVSHDELLAELATHGFAAARPETVTRTYRNGQERFEFVVAEAQFQG